MAPSCSRGADGPYPTERDAEDAARAFLDTPTDPAVLAEIAARVAQDGFVPAAAYFTAVHQHYVEQRDRAQ